MLLERICLKKEPKFAQAGMENTISHSGVIEQVEEGRVTVRVSQSSACAACSAARICRSGESGHRLIEVETSQPFEVGQQVEITGSTAQSRYAVVVAYVIPLIVVMAVLTGMVLAGCDEVTAALSSLLAVALYFCFLTLGRNRLKKQLQFSIHNVQNA